MEADRTDAFGRGPCPILKPLERYLDSLTTPKIWALLVSSIVLISGVNYLAYPIAVSIGPLYVLPLCLACWRLGPITGLAVAPVTAILHVGTCIAYNNILPGIALLNILTHTVALSILAGIISSFRYSFDREHRIARLDRLTGALNRHAFEDQAEAMLAASAVDGRPLLLAFLDLDGFKAVNDHHGHAAGDDVLQRMGAEALKVMRCGDCAGRVGGDEFAMLIRLPSIEASQTAARSLHARFTAALAGTPYAVTCSMGALVVRAEDGASLGELLCRADRLMYSAKRAGKNEMRFSAVAPPLEPELPLFAPSSESGKLADASAA